MTDLDAIALCAFQEANLEPDDGLAAVVLVILNRMRLRYNSDGTPQGVVFAHAQFSWTEYAMVGGVYTRVAHSPDEVATRAAQLLSDSQRYSFRWARAVRIASEVMAGSYAGNDYAALTGDTVLYINAAISSRQPWEVPENHVCTIGHHDFYRDPPRSGPVQQSKLGMVSVQSILGGSNA